MKLGIMKADSWGLSIQYYSQLRSFNVLLIRWWVFIEKEWK